MSFSHVIPYRNEEGFPKQSKVWEGNVSEPDTLEDVLLGLKKEENLFSSQRTIVMDAGIATEDNVALIKKRGFKYVAVSRKRTYDDSFWSEEEPEKIARWENNIEYEISPYRRRGISLMPL